jgi:hypothetical protein
MSENARNECDTRIYIMFSKQRCNDGMCFSLRLTLLFDIFTFYTFQKKFNKRSHQEDNNVQLFNRWLTHNMYRGGERLVTGDIYKCWHKRNDGSVSVNRWRTLKKWYDYRTFFHNECET